MEEIERRAERALESVPSWIWDGERLPVPIEHIADSHFGLFVRDMDDLSKAPGAPDLGPGQSFSGLLLPGRAEIWVNAAEAAEWPPRRRFTIGHELGHWCMHREDEESVFCRAGSIESNDSAPTEHRPARPPHEEEANAFAAALLMPARLIREQYKRANRDFDALCRAFGASGAAMGRRLHAVI